MTTTSFNQQQNSRAPGANRLSARENAALTRFEDIISTAERWRSEAAKALVGIRDRRLYRQAYRSFDDYVRERWGWERSRAYQLCQYGELLTHLSTKVDTTPSRESHARPLYPLAPEDQLRAWKEVLAQFGGTPSTGEVERIANAYRSRLSRSHTGVIPYCGSKASLVPQIMSHLPSHRLYCETHAGSAAVLLGKSPSRIEVLNDKDDTLVNFFRVLRERRTELVQLLRLTPYALTEWRQCQKSLEDAAAGDLEQARRFYVTVCQSFAGFGEKFNRSTHKPHATYWRDRIERLDAVAERLRTVVIEALDAEECLSKYDSCDTVFYVDPPYLPSTRSNVGPRYRCDMTEAQHVQLLGKLLNAKGKILLSSGDSPLYAKHLKTWRECSRLRLPSGTGGSKVGRYAPAYRTEVLWSNF